VACHSYWKYVCATWLKKVHSTSHYETVYLEYDKEPEGLSVERKTTVIPLIFEVHLPIKF
jgi:hypothetical protein